MEKSCYSLVWLLLLLFLAWPLSWFCAAWWVFFLPFEALFDFVRDINRFLEKLMSWPREVGAAVVNGSSQFPAPAL